MGNKIQGEGDYESARRFNKQQQEWVRRKAKQRQLNEMNDMDEMAADDDMLGPESGSDDADQDAITVIRQDRHRPEDRR